MDTEQALAGYRELADVTGWPEWVDGGRKSRLVIAHDVWQVERFLDGHYRQASGRRPHEALCLWERHVRLWLRKRGVWLQPSIATELYIVRCEGGGALVDGKWKTYQEDMPASAFCYAAAQQAAVRARKDT